MAVEAKRGCGYRKVNGTYLVGNAAGVPCDRLPLILEVCPTCSHGIKQSRGWTWVEPGALVGGPHYLPRLTDGPDAQGHCIYSYDWMCEEGTHHDTQPAKCWFCADPASAGLPWDYQGPRRVGLLWIGEKFYSTVEEFLLEGWHQGLSRRVHALPRGFVVGQTYIMLAHPKAVPQVQIKKADELIPGIIYRPGVFYLWLPQRVERLLPESKRDSEEVADLEKRGFTIVYVPDDDPDHCDGWEEEPEVETAQQQFEEGQ